MTVSTVSSKGWVVIPSEYRRQYGLLPGTKVRFVDYGGILSLAPIPEDPVNEGFGVLRRHVGTITWTEALLREHEEELTQEPSS